MANRCYINSLAQISCQAPLIADCFESPCIYHDEYVRAQEADTKGIIAPGEARRMSRILKRAVCTSLSALASAKVDNPDAIVTGTGMGCMENSEKFLMDLCQYGEQCLKPTLFMQSTHNTISSLIAITTNCHGYNNTYSHLGISFESALFDAWIQIKSGQISNALVGSHDEVTPFTAKILKKSYPQYALLSEASVASVISTSADNALAEVVEVELIHNLSASRVAATLDSDKDSYLMLGVNGNPLNDSSYEELLNALSFKPNTLQYRNVFGDNFSSSALSFYVSAMILSKQVIPDHFIRDCRADRGNNIDGITLLNHSEDNSWSIIRLKRI